MTNQDLLTQLAWRYAVKKFDSKKKISASDWATLEEVLVATPSSYGLQPWKFILVQDPAVRKKLTPLSWNQTQVEDCSHFVVFAVKTELNESYIERFISLTAQTRGMPPEPLEGYKKMMVGDLVKGPRSKIIFEWAARQSYIALGNLMTSAAVLKIDTCPMEGIDPVKYDETLGLGEAKGYKTVVACALGYRSTEDKYSQAKKVRFSKSDVIQVI